MSDGEKSIEELEAEYRKVLDGKIQAMKAEEELHLEEEKKNAEAEKIKQEEEAFNAKLESELDKKLTAYGFKPKTGMEGSEGDSADGKTGNDAKPHLAFRNAVLEKLGIDAKPYGFMMQDPDGNFAFTNSDAGCDDDISAWSPADTYCDMIWQEAQCAKQLSGVVTVQACDINAGAGLTVQIRTIDSSSMGTSLAACECGTCASNVFDTYSLTLARYDIYKVLCGLDLFDVGDGLKSAVIESMSRAFITGIDALIWTAIYGASPTCSQTLSGAADCDASRGSDGACCTYAAELYKAVVDAEADLRAAGYGAKGFYLILHPRIAAFLKYKEGVNTPAWVNNISMQGNKLKNIGDIQVIEYCGATDCTDKSSEVMAVLIDPERAVGEAYGKRPHLLTDNDPVECDSQKLVMRTYLAVNALDTGAICHIKNPA